MSGLHPGALFSDLKEAFVPVSKEEKKKGARLYAQRLMREKILTKECQKQNDENVQLIVQLQKGRPLNSGLNQIAYDYWKRRIIFENGR